MQAATATMPSSTKVQIAANSSDRLGHADGEQDAGPADRLEDGAGGNRDRDGQRVQRQHAASTGTEPSHWSPNSARMNGSASTASPAAIGSAIISV